MSSEMSEQMDRSRKQTLRRRAGRMGRVLSIVVAVAALSVLVVACGEEEAATTHDPGGGESHSPAGQGYGRGGNGRIATALADLVERETLTNEQVAVVEAAIEARIDETPVQGGGGRDWTVRLAQIETALDGLVADGTLSPELAEAVMMAIESRVQVGEPSQGPTSPDGGTATPSSATGV